MPTPIQSLSEKKGNGTWTFLEAETQVPRFLWLPLYARQASFTDKALNDMLDFT